VRVYTNNETENTPINPSICADNLSALALKNEFGCRNSVTNDPKLAVPASNIVIFDSFPRR
jgi:hypothetical protein